MKWYEACEIYHGKPIKTELRQVMQDELLAQVKGLTEQELITAIQYTSNLKWPKEMRITVPELRKWVYMYRKTAETGPLLEECSMCYKGWIDEGNNMAIPCNCSKGRRWLDKHVPPEEHGDMRDRAQAAIERKIQADKEAKTIAQDMKAKGATLTQVLGEVMKDQASLQAKIDTGEIKTKTVGWKYPEDEECPF